jgi:hypothetical protein
MKIPVIYTISPGEHCRVTGPRARTLMVLGTLPIGTWSDGS